MIYSTILSDLCGRFAANVTIEFAAGIDPPQDVGPRDNPWVQIFQVHVDVLVGEEWRKNRTQLEEGGWLSLVDRLAYEAVLAELDAPTLRQQLLARVNYLNAEPDDG